jgi:hypothetical protein
MRRRQFLGTVGRGGIAASLLGGDVPGEWGAMNVEVASPLPGTLRIHGNPVATRDKDCLGDQFTMSLTNDFDDRMGSSLLPDRLDEYVEAWAEVKAA